MNMQTVKKESEIKLDGLKVEITRKDGTAMGITLRDGNGGTLVIQSNGWGNGIDVLVPAPPKKVDRWAVKGSIKGVAFCELFDEEHKALTRMRDFDMPGEDVTVAMNKVEVDEETA